MAIATRPQKTAARSEVETAKSGITSEQVWAQLDRASFAVIGYITPTGEPRSSGVVYKTVGKRLYMVVAPDGWKARHIAAVKHVSVTVPVHRGGVLALVLPIPPATISFHATAIVHAAGSVKIAALSKELESLLPRGRRDAGALIELIPEGHFLTYGIGIPLMDIGCEAFVGDILTLPRRLHGKVVLRGHAGFDRLPHGPDPCVAMGPGCRVES